MNCVKMKDQQIAKKKIQIKFSYPAFGVMLAQICSRFEGMRRVASNYYFFFFEKWVTLSDDHLRKKAEILVNKYTNSIVLKFLTKSNLI